MKASIKKGVRAGDFSPASHIPCKLLHVHTVKCVWQKYVEGCAVQPWFPGPGAKLGINVLSESTLCTLQKVIRPILSVQK